MLRILQAVNIMDRAGLENMLMNYYRHIDRERIQFDFLTHRDCEGAYDSEIRELGGNIYRAPRLYPQNLKKYSRFMQDFYNEHPEYKIIHSHIDAMSYFVLSAAKQNNVSVRIAHSHTSKLEIDYKLPIKYFGLKKLSSVITESCACGKTAGEFMFPNGKYKIINNAIDLTKFQYNREIRSDVRNALGLDGKFVIGHVGRYCKIKNQMLLLDVFAEVKKIKPESILLLVGKGPDEQMIRNKISKLGLENSVMMLIDRSDVDRLYQAFDVFVLPSLFEGVPVVGIEAQASGLPCIVSDRISDEILITNNIQSIPIKSPAIEWANKILNCNLKRNDRARQELSNAGYDIETEAKKLQDWYFSLSDRFC